MVPSSVMRVYHSEPPLGGTPAQALEAFDHAIALDPGFAPAYEHTVELAIRLNRPDLARKYAAAYLRLDPTDVNAPATRLAALLLDPERSHAPEAARMIDSASTRACLTPRVSAQEASSAGGPTRVKPRSGSCES